jgi:hypothetical protein
MGEMRNVCKTFVGKTQEKRPLGRPRRRWKDNIRMDPSEIGWESVSWNQWQSLVSTEMNLRVP